MRVTFQGWPSQVRRFGIAGDQGILFGLEELIARDNQLQCDLEDEIRKVLAEQIQLERENEAKSRGIPVEQYQGLMLDAERSVSISFDHGIMATRPTNPVITLECLTFDSIDFFRRWSQKTSNRLKEALCDRLLPLLNKSGGSHAIAVISKDVEGSPKWNCVTRSVK